MSIVDFKVMVCGHTQVTVTTHAGSAVPDRRVLKKLTPRGIHTLLQPSNASSFQDWPFKREPYGFLIEDTALTWLHHGRKHITFTFPYTVEQALAAAYDEDGRPRPR